MISQEDVVLPPAEIWTHYLSQQDGRGSFIRKWKRYSQTGQNVRMFSGRSTHLLQIWSDLSNWLVMFDCWMIVVNMNCDIRGCLQQFVWFCCVLKLWRSFGPHVFVLSRPGVRRAARAEISWVEVGANDLWRTLFGSSGVSGSGSHPLNFSFAAA